MLGVAKKQPGDNLDYDIDFEDWLVDGDALLSAAAASDEGISVGDVEVIPPRVKVWLSGGAVGSTYKITVTAITTLGRVKEVTFNLRVAEC